MIVAQPLGIMVGAFSAVSAVAADLPKEGTFRGPNTAVGTYKTIKLSDVSLTIVDVTGLQITNGLLIV